MSVRANRGGSTPQLGVRRPIIVLSVARGGWLTGLQARPWWLATGLVLGLRVVLGVVGALSGGGTAADDGLRDFSDNLTAPGSAWRPLLLPWDHYDAVALTDISAHGYPRGDNPLNAFYPLFPALTAGVARLLGGHVVVAALVVSSLAAVVALVVMHRLVASVVGTRTAALAVVLVAVSPFGFFLLAAYTESLFLALSAGAFLAMQRRQPLLAGVLAAAAAACRLQGLVVAGALLLAVVLRGRHERGPRRRMLGDAVGVTLPAILVSLAFSAYELVVLGQPSAQWGAQHWYGRHGLAMPWTVLGDSIRSLASSAHPEELYNLLLLAVVLAALALTVRRLPRWWTAYALLSILLPLIQPSQVTPLTSLGRYSAVLFPAMAGVAVVARRRPLAIAVVAASAAVMLGRFVVFAHGSYVG